jgi:hypothetical protein
MAECRSSFERFYHIERPGAIKRLDNVMDHRFVFGVDPSSRYW